MSDHGSGSDERSAMQRALVAVRDLRAKLRALEAARHEPIAIIGVGCRLPPAVEDAGGFWSLLDGGVDAVRLPPPSRPELAPAGEPDPDAPERAFVRPGAYLEHVDGFDAGFFGIAPREAQGIDPQQRLLLETSSEAIEDAGLGLEALAGSPTGVFIGAGVEDWAQCGLRSGDADANDAYAFTGSDLSLAAGRIAYSFGLAGPALVVDTACSSSLVALHLAVQSLRAGESSLALVGGVNLILNWEVGLSLCRARALAPDGRCKSFAAGADGYGRGEGACVLVLKRLGDALADGDRLLAQILGSAVNQDGASSGLTVPNGLAQQALIRRALADARVRPDEVGYVEAHGTGTPLGDPIEVGALLGVLGGARGEPLLVGSVKTQIGHLEAAAGLAGVLKVALALRHQRLPPTLHFTALNPQIVLDGAEVVTAARPWPRGATRRVAGVSSFGMSGTNAHALLAEAPEVAAATEAAAERVAGALEAFAPADASEGGRRRLLLLSARSEEARAHLAARWRDWLRGAGAVYDLDEVCREAATRRSHHAWRLAVIGRGAAELADALDAFVGGAPTALVVAGRASAAAAPAFVCNGQGGAWARMGASLLAASPAARAAVIAFDERFAPLAGFRVCDLLRAPDDAWMAAPEQLLPAIAALQIALVEHWRHWGVTPQAVTGHSVGEVAAAYAAGVLGLDDAVRVARERGRLMQRTAGLGTMATVELGAAEVERVIADLGCDASVAALNAPASTAVSGSEAGIAALLAALEARGVRARRMAVNQPTHSARMEPILAELGEALAGVTPQPATTPLWSTVRGERARPGDYDARYWPRNVREPVRFLPVVQALTRGGAQTFLELGAHPILALPIAQSAEAVGRAVTVLPSLKRDGDAAATLLASLAALWTGGLGLDLVRLYGRAPRAPFDLPRHPWLRERYWRERPRPTADKSAMGTTASAATPAHAGLLYRVTWQPDAAAAPTTTIDDARGRWVILGDGAGLGPALAREIEHRGGEVTRLRDDGAAALGRALAACLPAAGAPPTRLVHLGPLALARVEAADGPTAGTGWDGVWHGAADLVAALAGLSGGAPLAVTVATRGAQPADGRGGDRVLQAMAWSLWGSLAFELEELAVRRVDLDPAVDAAADAAALVDAALASPSDAAAYRAGRRLVPRLDDAGVAAAPVALTAEATYLVTGGLGALGLAVAGALVDRGARHLALVGRRAPGAAAAARIAAWERAGCRVHVLAADVSQRADVARLVDALAATAPPLGGIVHAAGVLEDGLVTSQDAATFARVVAPKVAGAWHLHALTAGMPLDFFVLFSSIAGTLAPPGQASYAAANAGLDALARLRASAHLPAVSLGWGPWSEGGMAGGLDDVLRARLAARGLASLEPATGLAILDACAGAREPHLLAMPIPDRARLGRGFAFADGRPTAYLADVGDGDRGGAARVRLRDRLDQAPASERLRLVEDEVSRRVCAALGLPGPLRADVPFQQLGMDSLMAVTVRNALAAALGAPLPTTILFDHPTPAALGRELVRRLGGEVAAAPAPSAAALAEADLALLAGLSDSGLADEILASLPLLDDEVQT